MKNILIKNGRIWDGEQFFTGDVFVENGKISKIGEVLDCTAEFVYDAHGKTVSAGLVDVHAHMKGISLDIFGIQTEMSCLPFGVTTAADAGACQGDEKRLEGFAVKSYTFSFAEVVNNSIDAKQLEETIARYGKRNVGLKISFDVGAGNIKDKTSLEQVSEIAKAKQIPLTVHTSNSPISMKEIVNILKKGDILTHAFHGGANNCLENNSEALSLARERGIYIDAGFAGNVHTDFAVFKKALELGHVPDIISTDITCLSAYVRGGRYGMTMCMNIAKEFGMSEEDIFRAITSTPAKALGKETECGYLREGADADIAVFEYADEGFDLVDVAGNTARSLNGYRCVLTVLDGQIVYLR